MSKAERFAGSMTEGARLLVRRIGESKIRKAEEIKDFTGVEPEAQDESR
jgi:hypothetical protein